MREKKKQEEKAKECNFPRGPHKGHRSNPQTPEYISYLNFPQGLDILNYHVHPAPKGIALSTN